MAAPPSQTSRSDKSHRRLGSWAGPVWQAAGIPDQDGLEQGEGAADLAEKNMKVKVSREGRAESAARHQLSTIGDDQEASSLDCQSQATDTDPSCLRVQDNTNLEQAGEQHNGRPSNRTNEDCLYPPG